MSKHWSEKYDAHKHRNHMWGEGLEVERSEDQKSAPDAVYFVQVCSFTIEFHNLSQSEVCSEFYSRKIRPSSCIPESELWKYGGDHREVRRWFEKLPMKLSDNHRRPKVVKALKKALIDFSGVDCEQK